MTARAIAWIETHERTAPRFFTLVLAVIALFRFYVDHYLHAD